MIRSTKIKLSTSSHIHNLLPPLFSHQLSISRVLGKLMWLCDYSFPSVFRNRHFFGLTNVRLRTLPGALPNENFWQLTNFLRSITDKFQVILRNVGEAKLRQAWNCRNNENGIQLNNHYANIFRHENEFN